MSIFKSIKFELLILVLITLSIFASFNLDLFFYNYFINLSNWASGIFLKEFFSEITKLGNSSWYFSITVIGFVVFFINNRLCVCWNFYANPFVILPRIQLFFGN